MSTYKTRSKVASDGTLKISVPAEFANTAVRITVEPDMPVSGEYPPGVTPPRRVVSQAEWQQIVERVAGSLPDFLDVDRPGPDAYPDRGEWP